jgi:hypothetical protein
MLQPQTDKTAQLARDVALLRSETAELRKLLASLGPVPKPPIHYPEHQPGAHPRARDKTDEPRDAIEDALAAYGSDTNEITFAALIKAMARDMDGAVRDIRATRNDLNLMLGDTATRQRFSARQGRRVR